ncbi:MAG: hypothetical protein BWY10_00834 [Chloroflexi bacterium ADurb.Bin180]|nr:MAG: hypothetical protein BWY10_00834 [Chloroflexi bacterium ADurb.Bin180]
MNPKRRVLIEDWLPAQAIGVECMRENSTGLHPPPNRLHVWWARRPLTISRAAVLGSLLPADFPHDVFERLLGFYADSATIARNSQVLEGRGDATERIPNPHGPRAFSATIREPDVERMHQALHATWGQVPTTLDPMAGGGSIPLEAARLGLIAMANEYSPVACSILEATVDYPLRLGSNPATAARKWAAIWRDRFVERMSEFYAVEGPIPAYTYIFARTVPCPGTGHPTPLVGDWSLSRVKGGPHIVAEPVVTNRAKGEWTIRVRQVGKGAGQLRTAPQPTYDGGRGWSLFTQEEIPSETIKALAQQGQMGYRLYAVATKARKLEFRPPEKRDFEALQAAERELKRLRPDWERDGIVPTEQIPLGDKTKEPLNVGMRTFADMFAPRQLLAMGLLVEELRRLRPEILEAEGQELGEAVVHLLAFIADKFCNFNCILGRWDAGRCVIAGKWDRHDYAFKATFGELAACVSGAGLAWAIDNVLEAYEDIARLPRAEHVQPVTVTQGSATHLVDLGDQSVTAVVVDPPYADNVQYSELADFFYVWLKRTQGHRRPEWFSTYLSEHDQEAVVNLSRHREDDQEKGEARVKAHAFYQQLMTDIFRECHRVLRDDGVLTVMFTHKQQDAWANLFQSLIDAGFTISATWPVRTESQHSLHQANKNAAQSTVLLVARKREPGAERGYFDEAMQAEIRQAAQSTASRLKAEGLTAVDQLVGAFGPAMQVFTRYAAVKTDTGEPVGVSQAIQAAADAVADWRAAQLAERGLTGVDAESRFVLLCWDVLAAQEFRFNEAMLLGRSVGMDVNSLVSAGLVEKSGDKVRLLSAKERRREKALKRKEEQMELPGVGGGRRSRTVRLIHPADETFHTAIDACHALALRYAEAGAGQAGIGAARGMARQQGWGAASPCARLMDALVKAAPPAVQFPGKRGKTTAADKFPEFRAWHELLGPLFSLPAPEWRAPVQAQPRLLKEDEEEYEA